MQIIAKHSNNLKFQAIRTQNFLGFLICIYLISLNFSDEGKEFPHFNFLKNTCIKILIVKNSKHMEETFLEHSFQWFLKYWAF